MVQVKNDAAKVGGGWLSDPGWHHLVVDAVEVEDGQYGVQLKVEVSCLASHNKANIGLKKTEFLPVDGTGVGKLWRWGIALGLRLADGRLMTDELYMQIVGTDDKPGTREAIDFDETQAVGRQCCGKIELYKGKDSTKEAKPTIGFNWYAIGDPRAKDCPLDREAAAELLKNLPPANGTAGNGKANPPGQGQRSYPPATPAAPAAPAGAAAPAAGGWGSFR